MSKKLDRIGAVAISPRSWRIETRRLFLLGLPVALPLWLALCAALCVAFTVRAMLRPLALFWSAPPKRRRVAYDYDYGRRRGSRQGL